jgi:hypothetical protein
VRTSFESILDLLEKENFKEYRNGKEVLVTHAHAPAYESIVHFKDVIPLDFSFSLNPILGGKHFQQMNQLLKKNLEETTIKKTELTELQHSRKITKTRFENTFYSFDSDHENFTHYSYSSKIVKN